MADRGTWRGIAAGALGLLAADGAAAQGTPAQRAPGQGTAAAWPTESWNPRPAPGDLLLPLPCGGGIAFRPVPVPMPGTALADREVMLGQAEAETNYAEFLRRTFIAGAFPGPRPTDPPVFFIAKYEVTQDQYAAVMAPPGVCPPLPTQAGRLPRNAVAWSEAVAFTARLSAVLVQAAGPRLPRAGDAVAFARLPTEDEWEFAARGGSAVPEVEFVAPTYPMPSGMVAHEYFQGARSADGRVRPVGGLLPNPLGLHDMLGNVSEWALESYRMNKVGRPHGLAGGQVARGGHFRRAEDEIRASMREEYTPVNPRTGEPTRPAVVGLRPVLARTTVTGDAEARRLSEEFDEQARERSAAAEDPRRLLEVLRRDTADEAVRAGLTQLEAQMQQETRARRDGEAVSLRSRISAAAYLGRQLTVGQGQAQIMRAVGDIERERLAVGERMARDLGSVAQALGSPAVRNLLGPLSDDMRGRIEALSGTTENQNALSRSLGPRISDAVVPQLQQRLRELAGDYVSQIIEIARAADAKRLADEAAVVVQEAETRNINLMPEVTRVVAQHLGVVAGNRTLGADDALRDLGRIGEARPTPAPAPTPAPTPAPRR